MRSITSLFLLALMGLSLTSSGVTARLEGPKDSALADQQQDPSERHLGTGSYSGKGKGGSYSGKGGKGSYSGKGSSSGKGKGGKGKGSSS